MLRTHWPEGQVHVRCLSQSFGCEAALLNARFLLAVLLREEVAQLQEEVNLLRQMKDMLSKDLEETQGSCSADVLSATELRVQLAQKEQELDRAKEALQGNCRGRGGGGMEMSRLLMPCWGPFLCFSFLLFFWVCLFFFLC